MSGADAVGEHLDDLVADELDRARDLAAGPQQLAGGHPSRFRRPGPGGEGRVEDVDVDRQEDRAGADVGDRSATTARMPRSRTSCMKCETIPRSCCQPNSSAPGQ